VLLIPHLLDCLPQRIDRDSFFLALCLAKEARSHYFRVGYNSLGGFATINHLHFQRYAKKLALGQVRQELVETQINPAVWELSGHLVLKRRKDYEETTETSICQFLAEATLPENQFQEVKKRILSSVVQKFCK
jgi:hypothetical protein